MLEKFNAYRFAREFHWIAKELRLSPYLKDQLLRASSSVVLNIAEGSGKRTPPEQRRFYAIALGSLRECQAILDIERIKEPNLGTLADQLGAMLFTLSRPKRLEAAKNRTQTQSETLTEN